MTKRGGNKPSIASRLLLITALGTVLWQTYPVVLQSRQALEWGVYAWGIGAFVFAAGLGAVLRETGETVSNAWLTFRAWRPKRSEHDSDWLTSTQARKAGLGSVSGLFIGILDRQPLFITEFVHALCVAPSRSGKTTSLIIPALLHPSEHSRVVTDFGGDATQQCAERIRAQGHELITLDPAGLSGETGGSYNPLDVVLNDLKHAPQDAMADCRSISIALHAGPVGGHGDPFWPNGTRKILTWGLAALCVLRLADEANLPNLYLVLSDDEALEHLLQESSASDALGGELAALAKKILSTWDATPKMFEPFREGALQSLVTFGPSSRIAPVVMHSSFDPAALKSSRITLTLACDPSRMDQYDAWLKVTLWAIMKCLVREGTNKRVNFLLDEFTNYPLSGLPEMLTGLASSGVHLVLVLQEPAEVVRVYGPHALKTILSQTDLKLFFGASGDTARMLESWLGEEQVVTESFNLGGHAPAHSLARARRSRMLAAKIRELPGDETLAIIRNLPVARLVRAGFHEVEPWRQQVTPSKRFGGKRYLGKVKMIVQGRKARATRAGRRGFKRTRRPLIRPLLGALRFFIPGLPVFALAGAVLLVTQFGWPHLLWEYTRSHSWCRYLGPPVIGQSFELTGRDHCPIIMLKKGGNRP
ncbi:type IV secretory system conjugative DNA transfer family protein [Roseovarius sp. D22-M7]|uniref:type IV secretory system conjugative DNA transfer family protein n=1 Tax=Roseovarius sp. D22-M7 TaxID=3127116 RepID=UPI00300F8153